MHISSLHLLGGLLLYIALLDSTTQLRRFKVIGEGSKFTTIESPRLISYLISVESDIASVTVLEIFDIKANFP